ncbi:helix-turn-helix domain containing protein [Nocardiopsis sp. RSe5-2]|uniref:Helix-turn-helix domain containing protein n=1 Tax=Nocardiopsis endophytica TaxID=3018445 RepID=A0ABT4TYB9_9ACTN|nr:TetR/AcrR family transcriptional regulator [Nocardiopsis endophytica]MDA2809391.1 helix-turn-helix domain containing protein [Nocardiopsis endophytica]
MTVPPAASRYERSESTRVAIMDAAERLYAEEGLFAVSNRQVSEAAGQGNNAAVGYHFGTKADLVRAIVRRHTDSVEERRIAMVGRVRGSDDTRAWLACLVRPVTEHLDGLGVPTWFARFSVQVMADPVFRRIIVEEALSAPSLREIMHALDMRTRGIPDEVRRERGDMFRHLILNVCAERERNLAAGRPTLRGTWDEAATGLVDALHGLVLAPVSPSGGAAGSGA